MVTTNNGVTLAGLLYVQQADPRVGLDAWDDAIAALNTALADLAAARAAVEEEMVPLDRIEARRVLEIEGGNAETRKARLTLELADDTKYQAHLTRLREAKERVADADRRVTVQRERCRLLRAALALYDRAAAN